MSSDKTQPSFVFWEDSWNYTQEGTKDDDSETIIPEKV